MAIKLKGTNVTANQGETTYSLADLQTGSQGLGGLTPNASAKRFAYVDQGAKLTLAKATAFADSLIVVGDEERAWIPSLNTYVGPKKGDIEALQSATSTGVVTTLNGMTRDNYIVSYALSKYDTVTISDGSTGATLEGKRKDILSGIGGLSNGIQVLTYITYNDGSKDVSVWSYDTSFDSAKDYAYTHKDSFKGAYTVINDTKTLSNIKTIASDVISYSASFTKAWTDQEVNRLYAEILGISYIPKTFEAGDGVTNTTFVTGSYAKLGSGYYTGTGANAYIKVMVTSDATFVESTSATNIGAKSIPVNISYAKVIPGSTTALDWETYTTVVNASTTAQSGTVTDGKVTFTVPTITGITSGPVSLEVPVDNQLWAKNTTNASNLSNVTGAITTLNQVAAILDKITDGKSDDGISLAYSIADNRLDIDVLTYQMAKLTDVTGQTGDPNIKNVNGFSVANSSTDTYVTLTASHRDGEGYKENGIEHGNVTIQVGTTKGTITNVAGAAPSTNKPAGTAPTFTKNADGLLTTANVSDFSTYVNNTTSYILGVVDAKDNALAGSLIATHTDDSANNNLELFSGITYASGKYTIGTKHLKITQGSNAINPAPNSSNASEISISYDASENAYVLHNVTYTLSLSSSNITSANAKNLATAQDVHSYIMNLISWVDLSGNNQ